jgi:redox-sensing transcriptional repressor
MQKRQISQAIIRRMPRYYRYVLALYREGVERVSSRELSQLMDITASQIRQDFNCFGGFGQQGYGYNVKHLYEQLSQILGLDQEYSAVILGAGNLGRALLNNFSFEIPIFNFSAAFDSSPAITGNVIGGVPVYDIAQLEDYINRNKTDIAVLTVPQQAAFDLIKRLETTSIRGIWNFTNLEFTLSRPDIYVEHVHFSDSLINVFYNISRPAQPDEED